MQLTVLPSKAVVLVLDTDHLSEIDRGSRRGDDLMARLARSNDDIATTIMSVEEQLRGWLAQIKRKRDLHEQISAYARLQGRLTAYAEWTVLPWDAAAVSLFEDLRRNGNRVGTMDLKIACVVLSQDATLLRRNVGDFSRVPGLRIENWL